MDYVLIADQTALPALLKRLERLSGGRVVVLAQRPDSEMAVTILPAGLTHSSSAAWLTASAATRSRACHAAMSQSHRSLDKAEWHWVHDDREHAFALNQALRGLHLPQGQTQAWVACSSTESRLIRRQLVEDHGVSPDHIECVFYASASRRSSTATESGLKPAMM
ncbi:SIP domain-containing protein [Asticcacaulis sp. EMRT-3]|uniref:SIP domain-containing protein n=1 Tax=Asticcacaulis sp. EMRT-3 TaxID=3040349 RepID=UPI0024AEC55C|nr:SIP domain-containing protein [Asticcacaulis sp. EMRT-3]MDI7774650.1 SIP domain-containing protein [Asticcacaulis sp. EMRT-3]